MNAQSAKGVLQMVGTFLNISIYRYSNDKVEVGIYQLLVSLAITSCTFLMSSTAIWLLGFGILA